MINQAGSRHIILERIKDSCGAGQATRSRREERAGGTEPVINQAGSRHIILERIKDSCGAGQATRSRREKREPEARSL